MPTETPIPKDHPLMVAWEAYKATPDYANTRKWASHDEHVDGSLWAAFSQGWFLCENQRTEENFSQPPTTKGNMGNPATESEKPATAPIANLNFGQAIEALKNGRRVTRPGWNGRGMYLWLLPATLVKAEWCKEPHLKQLAEQNGGEIRCLGSIRMLTADKKVLTGWLASQSDVLAEDWMILE
ncbi:MAG TPA: DUF2829 domain-containing protein [Candidatus Binatia bacterium]|nr:DUF2829 domain-containing protein [Candidatus Binatia bacterium]